MQETSLDQLKTGQTGVIKALKADGLLRSRLMDMGLIKGSPVTIVRVAPFGDPIEIEVKGYNLSLRKNEAKNIVLEQIK